MGFLIMSLKCSENFPTIMVYLIGFNNYAVDQDQLLLFVHYSH